MFTLLCVFITVACMSLLGVFHTGDPKPTKLQFAAALFISLLWSAAMGQVAAVPLRLPDSLTLILGSSVGGVLGLSSFCLGRILYRRSNLKPKPA